VRVKTVALADLPRSRRSGFMTTPLVTPRTRIAPSAPFDYELRQRLEEQLNRAGQVYQRLAPTIRAATVNRVTI
jgi:hypothetical protein